jgi:filamentous hemagglutinin family protein
MAAQGCTPHQRRRLALTLLLSSVLFWALRTSGQAQITLDGSLGPAGPLTGPQYQIGAELGQIRGSNLFHSFGQFHVQTGERATFTGPNTIANILSRVTGGQPSSIDGLLRAEIAGANLFLLNPSGVLFGPNASLDVSGSFHVSTADFLRFTGAEQEKVLVTTPASRSVLHPRLKLGYRAWRPLGRGHAWSGGDFNAYGPTAVDSPMTVSGIGARSGQLFVQRLGLLEVRGVKALSEPAVDRGQQFQRFHLLAAGGGEGAMKTGFRLSVRTALCRASPFAAPPPSDRGRCCEVNDAHEIVSL